MWNASFAYLMSRVGALTSSFYAVIATSLTVAAALTRLHHDRCEPRLDPKKTRRA